MGVMLFWFGGIFIDVDHYLDYVRGTGDVRISLRKMQKFFSSPQAKKFYIFFHSYELIVLLCLLNFFYLRKDYLYGLLAGFVVHIILDVVFNHVKIKGYLFLYRLKHSFEGGKFFFVK
jgi:hypothetical protein